MKYFTPELLARCRSLDDDVADAAAAEWEQALVAYQSRFTTIRSQLPSGVRRLCARVTLHDARLIGLAFGNRKPRLGMLLELEGASGVLELNYHPVAGPHGGVSVRAHSALDEKERKGVWVLYDEFDVDEERAFFTHSLLLTDGREIEIRFHSLNIRLLEEAVSPAALTEGEKKWPVATVPTE